MSALGPIKSFTRITANSFNYSQNNNAIQPILTNKPSTANNTSPSAESNDFWQDLKQIFVQGILEKALLAYTFWEMTHKKFKLHNSLLIPISALAGIIGGSLFIKLEHFIDKTVCKLLNAPDEDDSKNDNKCKHQIFPWSPSALLAKSISLFLILSLVIGKKIFLISHLDADNKFGKFISKTINHFAIAAKLPESKVKDLNEISKNNKNSSLADHLDNHAKFMQTEFSNPLIKAGGWGLRNIVGLPSFTTAKRNIEGKVKFDNLLGDASLKMAVLLPIGLAFKAFMDIIHQAQESSADDNKN